MARNPKELTQEELDALIAEQMPTMPDGKFQTSSPFKGQLKGKRKQQEEELAKAKKPKYRKGHKAPAAAHVKFPKKK